MSQRVIPIDKHAQWDAPWFAVWGGFRPRYWMFGVVIGAGGGLSLAIGLGPFYVGIGSYS